MKKILIILGLLILLLGLSKSNQENTFEDFKKTIENNIKKTSDITTSDIQNEKYKNDRYYKRIKEKDYKSVLALIQLNEDGLLDDNKKLVATLLIQDITNCNLNKEYNLNIDNPDDFFQVWKNNNCNFKEKLEKENTTFYETQKKYPDFAKLMKQCKINLPILKDMIPQGITIIGDYTFITAYNTQENNNSKVYILNKNGEIINIATLDTISHVGSISYDKINDLIWIPGKNGELHAYETSDFYTKKEVTYKYKFENLSEGLLNYQNKNKKHIAYLCIDDSYIYIGSFTRIDKGTIKKYKIISDELEGIKLEYINEFKVPSKNQGITFYNHEEKKYMILSKSYGRSNPSYIAIYQYDENIKDYSKIKPQKFKLPPLLEQISTFKEELFVIFESNASKYNDCTDKVGNICTLDLNYMIEEFLTNEQSSNKTEKKKKQK